MQIINEEYSRPSSFARDTFLDTLSDIVKPFVKVVNIQYGKFNSQTINEASSTLPAAFVTRLAIGGTHDTSGNAQKTLISYAVAIAVQNNLQDSNLEAIHIENGIINALQDFISEDKNISSFDITTKELDTNNITAFTITVNMPFVFELKENDMNDWIHGGCNE